MRCGASSVIQVRNDIIQVSSVLIRALTLGHFDRTLQDLQIKRYLTSLECLIPYRSGAMSVHYAGRSTSEAANMGQRADDVGNRGSSATETFEVIFEQENK